MPGDRSHLIKHQLFELYGLRQEDAAEMQERMRQLYHNRLLPLIDRYLSRISPDGRLIRIERLELDLGYIGIRDFESALLRELEQALQSRPGSFESQEEAPAATALPAPESLSARHSDLFQYFTETGSLPWWAETRAGDPVAESLDYLLDAEPEWLKRALQDWLPREFYLRRLVRQLPPDRLIRLAGLQFRQPAADFGKTAGVFFQLLAPVSAALGIPHTRLSEEARLKLLQIAFFTAGTVTDTAGFWHEWWLQLAVVFRLRYGRLLAVLQDCVREPARADALRKAGVTAIIRQLVAETRKKPPPAGPRPAVNGHFEAVFTALAEALEIKEPGQANSRSDTPLQVIFRWLEQQIPGQPPRASTGTDASGPFQATLQKLQSAGLLTGQERQVLAGALNQWPPPPSPATLKALGRLVEIALARKENLRPVLAKRWASDLEAILRGSAWPARSGEGLRRLARKLRSGSLGRPEIKAMLKLSAGIEPAAPGRESPDANAPAGLPADISPQNAHRDNPEAAAGATERPAPHRAKSRGAAFSETNELFIANAGLVILWPYLARFFRSLGLVEDKQFVSTAAAHRAAGLLQYLADGLPEVSEYLLGFNKILCGLDWDEVLDFGEPVTDSEAEECGLFLEAVIANAPVLKTMSVDGFRGSFLLRKGMLRAIPEGWQLHVEKETYDVVLERFPWSWKMVKLPWLEGVVVVEW